MNIIFLDIDGILNCQVFYDKHHAGKKIRENNICPERVSWLNELCSKLQAKVVISSSWRMSGMDYCIERLKIAGATFEVIGITPRMGKHTVRGNEIKAWIELNVEKHWLFHTYVIIDDDSDMLLQQRDHFFQTDEYSGLTPNLCYKIERYFEKLGVSVNP